MLGKIPNSPYIPSFTYANQLTRCRNSTSPISTARSVSNQCSRVFLSEEPAHSLDFFLFAPCRCRLKLHCQWEIGSSTPSGYATCPAPDSGGWTTELQANANFSGVALAASHLTGCYELYFSGKPENHNCGSCPVLGTGCRHRWRYLRALATGN